MAWTPLVPSVGNLNSQRFISQVLPAAVTYLPGLGEVTFQYYNARPHISPLVLINLDMAAGFDCCPGSLSRSPDLSLIENIKVERPDGHCCPVNTIESWHRLVAAWNDFALSVIQSLFASLPNRVSAILAACGGNCVY
ncbi:hypothetical protein TNCV_3461921 [Trichonephila clavipes]|nr:hypothetical protein TNCV_3461921 [Trichonephila clavipes]